MNTPPSSSSFDRDLLRYAEGSLSDEELALFQVRLAAEPALRNDLRALAEQAFAIGEHARNTEAISEIKSRSGIVTLPKKSRASWKIHLPWAAAAVLVISTVLFFLSNISPSNKEPATIVEVLEVSGSASWVSEDGARTVMLEKGMRLPAGAMELSSESSLARFRYDDGSLLTFTGISEAVITQESGKFLNVKRGQLVAKVSPQDPKAAMRIKTPTADVTVLGTQFSLNVGQEKTGLGVFEGMVRMRRLSDGQEQNVSTGRRLTSTLETDVEFVPTVMPEVKNTWSSDFRTMPGITQGEWISPDQEYTQGAIAAKAYVAWRQPDGGIITHYGVVWKSSDPGFAMLNDNSILRLKVRVKTATAIQLILGTRMPDYTYTGNFEANPILLQPAANGAWQDIEIPISQLKAPQSEYSKIPSGAMVYSFVISSYQKDVGLQVEQFSLQSSN